MYYAEKGNKQENNRLIPHPGAAWPRSGKRCRQEQGWGEQQPRRRSGAPPAPTPRAASRLISAGDDAGGDHNEKTISEKLRCRAGV